MAIIKEFNVDSLKVRISNNEKAMGEDVASMVADKIKEILQYKDEVNVIFAAAPSQNEFIKALLKYKDIAWNKINAFHMDEYIGMDSNAPLSLSTFLRENIFNKVPFKSINLLDGMAKEPEKECERYAELLSKYPVDILLGGIGDNGHLAFNDPHIAEFDDKKIVKIVDIDDKSKNQQANGAGFSNTVDVPSYSYTITIPGLMASKWTYITVPFVAKSEAVKKTLYGEITQDCPASIIRTHKNAVLFLDPNSANKIL